MKHLLVILCVLCLFLYSCHKNIDLRNGDLLFKQEINDSFSSAIANATVSVEKYNFTHVGIACRENNKWFVLEAINKGVCKTPLRQFLNQKSIVVIGRLKKAWQPIIPKSIESIKQQIGKPYDNYFSADNNAYYCSELIQQHFLQNDTPIFAPIKMTFKNRKNRKFPAYWINHFKALNVPIPEGENGSNPGQLSTSDKIQIIGQYKLK